MKLTYLFHSGFSLETANCIVIFDYWMDPSDVVKGLLQSDKKMYVLSSHHHEDHFNHGVLLWKRKKPNITYLLAADILENERADKAEADVWMRKGDCWQDEHLKVTAMGSNDCGVSWIVEVEGKRIFHAGDLNNWYAKFLTDRYLGRKIFSYEFGMEVDPEADERIYLQELEDIQQQFSSFDVALFPVDGRIGNGYMLGARQFIDRFKVKLLVPMHFVLSGFEPAWRMKEYTDTANVDFWGISYNGEYINL